MNGRAVPRIRRADACDYPALAALWRAGVLATHDFLAPDDLEEIHERLAAVYLPGVESLWLAEEAGRIAGYLGANSVPGGRHVEMLFVSPDFFGQGVGTTLLRHVHGLLGGRGTLTVDVNEQNPQARAFYERRGFVVIGRSARDNEGRPYPLLHLRLAGADIRTNPPAHRADI